tara:strand:+ start:631 stop:1554 length:924 start_codon:yes stop_codon:yes gene_type:complete
MPKVSIDNPENVTQLHIFRNAGAGLSGTMKLTEFTNLNDFRVLDQDITSLDMDMSNKQYVKFRADDNLLSGSLPEISGQLNMKAFNVPRNQFTGPAPAPPATSNFLFYDVSNNNLTNPSAPDFSSCPQIKGIFLHASNFTGTCPNVDSNVYLEDFQLDRNSFTGAMPSITNNTALKWFDTAKNNLTGEIVSTSTNVNMLEMWCNQNDLIGSIPDLANNTSMYTFSCFSNNLTGWAGTTLPASLTKFIVNHNNFSAAVVEDLLAALVAAGANGGFVNVAGNGGMTVAALGHKNTLTGDARGNWTVIYN